MNKKLSTAITVLAVALVGFLVYQERGKPSNQTVNVSQIYNADDNEKPILTIEPASLTQDLGPMKVSEERVGEFTLKNTGTRPLIISRLRTSCMCTFGEITVGNKKSPRVNMEMHNSASAKLWQLKLEPNETAIARVVYHPALMPVQGPAERLFIFDTNDPIKPKIELIIKAFVTR